MDGKDGFGETVEYGKVGDSVGTLFVGESGE